MEFQTLKFQALEKLKVADHLVGTTYSLVKEPKLLVSVIENIVQALELAVTALIEYEKNFRTIPKYDTTFNGGMEIFRRKIMTKYNISNEVLDFITDVKKTLDEHKKSAVEFTKKDKSVISDNDYNITTLNVDSAKKTLAKAKYHIEGLFKIMKYE
jgi:lipopolysaccharide biosynthesis glycosyltransferase